MRKRTAAPLVPSEIQRQEAGQAPQPCWNRAGQQVVVKPQTLEVHQAFQVARDRPAQLVAVEVQRPEAGNAPQPRRNRAGQLAHRQAQVAKLRQVPQPRRNRATQRDTRERQPFEVLQTFQFARKRAAQLVPVEAQRSEDGQVTQRRRNAAGQPVAREPQLFDVRQVRQFARDRAAQLVPAQVQSRDPAVGIRRHAVPLAQGRRRLPVRVVGPVRAPGRVVERLERGPVRRGAPLSGGLGGQTPEAEGSQQERPESAATVASGRRPQGPTLLPTDTPAERGTDGPVVHICGRPNCGRPNVSELRVRCACLSSVISCCFHQISYTRTPGTEDAPFRPRDNVIRAGGRRREP